MTTRERVNWALTGNPSSWRGRVARKSALVMHSPQFRKLEARSARCKRSLLVPLPRTGKASRAAARSSSASRA